MKEHKESVETQLKSLPKISIVVPTRDRPKELFELLTSILDQSYPPHEVIIVNDSPIHSVEKVVDSLSSQFKSIECELDYLQGSGDGLPAARNLGAKVSEGDAVLFLDDDTLLDANVVGTLATFFRDNPHAVGVQPKISLSTHSLSSSCLSARFENVLYKTFMLSYKEKNKLAIRRSGMSISPNDLTKSISAQRLSGCCCYRREVFHRLRFDINLKRWGYMEDLDFSCRVYKKNPHSLYLIPHCEIIHKATEKARLPTRTGIYMTTIYWFYVFFKEVFEHSIVNLTAFLLALVGKLVVTVGGLITKRKTRNEWWSLIYLLTSYLTAFRNLKNILMQRLEFFNKNL